MKRSIFATVALATMLVGCNTGPQPPGVSDVKWNVTRQADKSGYHLTGSAKLTRTANGWYQPVLTLVDQRGCRNGFELPETRMVDPDARGEVSVAFDYVAPVKRRVATAQFAIRFDSLPQGSTDAASVIKTALYSGDGVIDANVRQPDLPDNPCAKPASELRAGKRDRLRAQAKRDPDGADAAAVRDMSQDELLATAINTAGFLCAKVRDAYPASGGIIVSCTEYRSGRGRARYRIDTTAMDVTKLD